MSMNPFMYVCMHVCIHLSVCLPICLSVYLSVYRACIYLSVSIYCTSIYPPTCVSIHNMCLSVSVCIYETIIIYLSIHLSVSTQIFQSNEFVNSVLKLASCWRWSVHFSLFVLPRLLYRKVLAQALPELCSLPTSCRGWCRFCRVGADRPLKP